jgi:hypothetical protein
MRRRLAYDGARIANALARMNASPAQATWMAGVTRYPSAQPGRFAAAEAGVLRSGAGGGHVGRRKRGGQLISKHRFRRPTRGLSRRGSWPGFARLRGMADRSPRTAAAGIAPAASRGQRDSSHCRRRSMRG